MATPKDDLPALDPGLEALLAAERELPPVPPGLEERLWARLGRALGWGAGGAGGGLLAAWLIKLALVLGAAGGTLAIGWLAVRGGGGARERPETGQPGGGRGPRLDAARGPASPPPLPAWFGEPDQPAVAIAGHVVGPGGAPVADARVVLTSNLSRAGVVDTEEVRTDARGAFGFAARRAAVYDLTAAAAGQGEGHARVTIQDPTARPRPDDVVIALPGCAHALVGTVRDASGGVIAGAQVTRARGRWADVSPLGLGAITDERGGYELCTPPGPLTAIVHADGYGAMTVLDTVIGRRRVDVELMPAATVIGRVVRAEDDRPVPQAMVWLRPSAYPPRLRTTPVGAVTDDQGRFRFAGVAPGRHLLFATTGDTLTPPPGVYVVVAPGGESAELVVRVASLAVRVEGRVVEDGRPVAGARVFAVVAGQRIGGGWPPADADGRFAIRLVEAGPIGFALDTHDVVAPREHRAMPGVSQVVVEVVARGAIRGLVTHDGEPVPGAEVAIGGPTLPTGQQRVDTDDAGRFELPGLPAGRYWLSAMSYRALAFTGKEITIELAARERRDGVVLELDGGASIAGTVVDEGGAPVAGVAVRWSDPVSGDLCDAATAADGGFTCVMIAGGADYAPVVRLDETSAQRLPAATADGLAPVHVADGRTRITGVVLRVKVARATLRGQVVDLAGAPYPDVSVRAIEASTGYTPETAPWTGVRTAITDADGRFALPVWADAAYAIHARAPTGAEASIGGVTAGGPPPVLRLGRAGRIVGALVGFAAPPRMLVRRLGNTVDATTPVIDGDRFVADGLSAGRYAVMAVREAQAAALTVEVRDGADATVTLAARPAASLTAQVIDFVTGAPVAAVGCSVAPFVDGAGVAWWGTAAPPTGADGRFAMAAPSGDIEVTCHARAGRHSEGASRTVAGERAELTIPVVVIPPGAAASNGLGVRLGFAHAPARGHLLSIVELRPGGAGERAGLRVGDAITAVDGRDVTALTDSGLLRMIGLRAVGDVVRLTVRRGATAPTIAVTVEGPWWP